MTEGHALQLHFDHRQRWRAWLQDNHATCRLVWLVFYKKHTGRTSLSYDAAVEEALCFGWIDSIIKRLDDDRYARKFTPRTDPRRWSAANLARVERLVASGQMTEHGLVMLAPDVAPLPPVSSRSLDIPPEFAAALDAHPAARRAFDALPPSHRRNYLHWVGSAKREQTRARRLAEAITRLSQGQKLGMK